MTVSVLRRSSSWLGSRLPAMVFSMAATPSRLRVGCHAGELLVETHAGQHFDLFAGETSVRRRLVETTRYPLYRYPFHLLNRIKKSRSSAERDPSCFHSIVLYS